MCTNTVGSFQCICRQGYAGNGVICAGMFKIYILAHCHKVKAYCSKSFVTVFAVPVEELCAIIYPLYTFDFHITKRFLLDLYYVRKIIRSLSSLSTT